LTTGGSIVRTCRVPATNVFYFFADRFNAAALGVLREIGDGQSLVAILDLNSDVFDIMPAELRAHSEVLLELGDGSEVGRFSLKGKDEFSQLV
jgi:hypothetical protein